MTVSRIVQLVHVGGIGLPSIDDPCHFLGPIQGLWRRRRCYARDGGQGGHYWDAFDRPKVMYQDIAWNPRFCLDTAGTLSNNTVYFLSTDDAWTLAALNASRRAAAGSVDVWFMLGGQWTERCLRVRTLAEGTKLAREWIEERTRNTVFRATSETQALDAPPYGEGT